MLKSADFSWKRMRRSLKSRRNELDFRFFQEEIEILQKMEDSGEVDLYYFDETGINLTPSIPYAWQAKGVRTLIPTSKSQNITILGFINRQNKLYSYVFEGAANSKVVIECMDRFCKEIDKKTILILDNASIHKSNAMKIKRKEWEEKGLFLQFLPPYCPELNLIELLWKFLKYYWIDIKAYASFSQLKDHVIEILEKVGTGK